MKVYERLRKVVWDTDGSVRDEFCVVALGPASIVDADIQTKNSFRGGTMSNGECDHRPALKRTNAGEACTASEACGVGPAKCVGINNWSLLQRGPGCGTTLPFTIALVSAASSFWLHPSPQRSSCIHHHRLPIYPRCDRLAFRIGTSEIISLKPAPEAKRSAAGRTISPQLSRPTH